jgi:lipopolysaccharide transport system permease protein
MPADRITIIGPAGSTESYLRECWRFRGVVWFLARRDLMIRYRMTLLGIAWVWFRPLLAAAIFTIIFSHIAHLPPAGAPYPLLVLIGMLPWQFFASVVNESSISLANNPNLITKVWLPRILIPLSTIVLNSVDLLVNAILVAAMMTWYHVVLSIHILALPLALIPLAATSIGCGLLCSALMVKFRDVKNVIPVLLQFGLICSPISFTLRAAPPDWARWLWLNPLSTPIELLRWCLLPGMPAPPPLQALISAGLSMVILVIGYAYFRRNEGSLADVL